MWRATLSRSPRQRRTLLLQLRKADSDCLIRVLLPLWGQGALSVTVSHGVREPSLAELEAPGVPAHRVAHAAGACDLFVAGVVPEVGDLAGQHPEDGGGEQLLLGGAEEAAGADAREQLRMVGVDP
jgi:hypothetical protein